jgi:hypothetical protein
MTRDELGNLQGWYPWWLTHCYWSQQTPDVLAGTTDPFLLISFAVNWWSSFLKSLIFQVYNKWLIKIVCSGFSNYLFSVINAIEKHKVQTKSNSNGIFLHNINDHTLRSVHYRSWWENDIFAARRTAAIEVGLPKLNSLYIHQVNSSPKQAVTAAGSTSNW